MRCSNCNYEIDETEYFCGNCGQQLKPQLTNNVTNNQLVSESLASNIGSTIIPGYARLQKIPRISKSSYVCLTAVILGIITTAFVSSIVGLGFGLIALIAATFISRYHHLRQKILGIVMSVGIIVGTIFLFVHYYDQPQLVSSSGTNSAITFTSMINTNCYSFNLPSGYYLSHLTNNCSIMFYDGTSISTSNNFYKILSLNDVSLNSTNFVAIIKPLISQDVRKNLVNFHIIKERSDTFAGNLAYQVVATNNTNTLSIIEEGVYHPSTQNNLFDIIYASQNNKINLKVLQTNWLWKN